MGERDARCSLISLIRGQMSDQAEGRDTIESHPVSLFRRLRIIVALIHFSSDWIRPS